MNDYRFTAGKDDDGWRLDAFLVRELPDFSRSFLQKKIKTGEITLNGGKVKPGHLLREGDSVVTEFSGPEEITAKPEEIPLDIYYEDEHLIVVNKPVGMVVHPAPGNSSGTLVNALLFHCRDLSGINGMLRPGIVHRIDKDTSGLLVAAKSDFVHRDLARQFSEKTVNRKYRALVRGIIKEPGGIVDAPVGRDPRERTRMAVVTENSKDAVTEYRVLERFRKNTYVECVLRTGRTHQIRVHMSYIGYPLLGDAVYGEKDRKYGFAGQALHAMDLGFVHPVTKEQLDFSAPLPEIFRRSLEKMEKENEG